MRKSFAPSFQTSKARVEGKSCRETVFNSSSNENGATCKSVRSAVSILDLLKENNESRSLNELPCQRYHSGNVSPNFENHASSVIHSKKSLNISKDSDDGENFQPLPSDNVESKKRKFSVVWGKLSKKKHKKWEGDGVAEIGLHTVILKDCDGKVLGSTRGVKTAELEEGSRLIVGGKEIELIDVILDDDKGNEVEGKLPKPEIPTAVTRPAKKPKLMISKTFIGVNANSQESLVMLPPPSEHQWLHNQEKLLLVDVVVDPYLSKALRPHQRVGVQFLYECVCGMRNPFRHQTGLNTSWEGCILADEMGLGKTLQCITLIWTLLRKGPYGNKPVFHKVLIITPSSLAANWLKEFQCWLGRDKIKPFVVNQKNRPIEFLKLQNNQVMIISYEMVVRCIEDIKKIGFDVMICDEGHRLKNTIIKTSQALAQLSIKRRILLSGTPIQNDLQEFYSLVDFVNPGILGSNMEFRKHYELPILASRQPHCSEEKRRLGETRAAELNSRTAWFILRRTQAVINQYLPKKLEAVIFCRPFPLQAGVLKHLQNELKCCDKSFENLSDHSGKLWFVENMLHDLSQLKEKVILVSYYTKTLDIFAELCKSRNYKFCRLDGTVPTAKRMAIVDSFNNPNGSNFVFLLSARAGGVGLNLTGASRLVLYDSDWNPASDLQAMARIWRDGQKRSVYIYRLLTTGTVEEKIYQRQINKTGLSGAVVDPQNPSGIKLSLEELKDLFTFHETTSSLTHDLLDCKCLTSGANRKDSVLASSPDEIMDDDERECQLGMVVKTSQKASLPISQLNNWQHLSPPFEDSHIEDMGFSFIPDHITFIFQSSTS
ncbi:DNA repair and recombination protein RAD54B-like isoform X2 [Hetaerina americana]|uniref:DNA repair and recombination protein RAD54B-like isoform X2 n=1 Tax=Hetaerina americana TaxID=62018 RepID=UPI003A7F132C